MSTHPEKGHIDQPLECTQIQRAEGNEHGVTSPVDFCSVLDLCLYQNIASRRFDGSQNYVEGIRMSLFEKLHHVSKCESNKNRLSFHATRSTLGKLSRPPTVDGFVVKKRKAVLLSFSKLLDILAFKCAGTRKQILPDLEARDAKESIMTSCD